jgi:PAS domain S-box-containing protein
MESSRKAAAVPRAEDALRDIEFAFRGAVDAAPVLIWRSGTDKLCTWFNRRWLEFVGRPMEAEVGNGWAENVHADDFQGCVETYHAAFDARQVFSMEYRLRRRDGAYRWITDDGIPLYDADGAFTGYIGFCHDITDRKQAEQAVREANRRKDEYLAMLAHELRNPLAAIGNAVHVLSLSSLDPQSVRSAAGVLERQVRHLVRQVDALLDVSRFNQGKIELHTERADLNAIVRDAVEAIGPLAEGYGHRVAVTLAPEPVYVVGDHVRLAQVVGNLLHNACKFTDRGGHVGCTVAREAEQAVVRVWDTGVGIPADQLNRIFEMFAQVDASLTRVRDGLGLGLTVVKSLVELHGGAIEARSEGPGRGSEFVVRLPVAGVEVRSTPSAERAPALESLF